MRRQFGIDFFRDTASETVSTVDQTGVPVVEYFDLNSRLGGSLVQHGRDKVLVSPWHCRGFFSIQAGIVASPGASIAFRPLAGVIAEIAAES